MTETKTNLTVKLIGEDGNIFNLIGVVTREMKRSGYRDQVEDFQNDITSSKSYDQALQRIMTWVTVE